MKRYTTEFLAKELEAINALETIFSVEGRDAGVEIDCKDFELAAFGGEGEYGRVWIYPRAHYGLGIEVEVNKDMTLLEMMERSKEVNQIKHSEAEGVSDVITWFDDAYTTLMVNIKHLIKRTGTGVYTNFLGGTTITYLGENDTFLLNIDGLVIELGYWDLQDVPEQTTFYQKVIADTTLWDVITLNASIKNQLGSNK